MSNNETQFQVLVFIRRSKRILNGNKTKPQEKKKGPKANDASSWLMEWLYECMIHDILWLALALIGQKRTIYVKFDERLTKDGQTNRQTDRETDRQRHMATHGDAHNSVSWEGQQEENQFCWEEKRKKRKTTSGKINRARTKVSAKNSSSALLLLSRRVFLLWLKVAGGVDCIFAGLFTLTFVVYLMLLF